MEKKTRGPTITPEELEAAKDVIRRLKDKGIPHGDKEVVEILNKEKHDKNNALNEKRIFTIKFLKSMRETEKEELRKRAETEDKVRKLYGPRPPIGGGGDDVEMEMGMDGRMVRGGNLGVLVPASQHQGGPSRGVAAPIQHPNQSAASARAAHSGRSNVPTRGESSRDRHDRHEAQKVKNQARQQYPPTGQGQILPPMQGSAGPSTQGFQYPPMEGPGTQQYGGIQGQQYPYGPQGYSQAQPRLPPISLQPPNPSAGAQQYNVQYPQPHTQHPQMHAPAPFLPSTSAGESAMITNLLNPTTLPPQQNPAPSHTSASTSPTVSNLLNPPTPPPHQQQEQRHSGRGRERRR